MKRINNVLIIVVILIGCKENESITPKEKVAEGKETEFTFETALSNRNSKDACVIYWYPTENGGPDDTTNLADINSLSVMHWLPYDNPDLPAISRLYIQFDLTAIPKESIIDSATLYLYPNKDLIGEDGWKDEGHHFYDSFPNKFSLYQILDSWDEQTISWVNIPLVSDLASGQYGPFLGQEIIKLDLKELAQLWVNNPLSNHGIFLQLDDERSNQRIVVGSTESSYKPKIVVNYQKKD